MADRISPTKRLACAVALLNLIALVACGETSDPGAGEETGPCVEGYCVGSLECASDLCVDPGSMDTDAEPPDEDPDPSDGDTGSPPETSGSTPDSDGSTPTAEPWCDAVQETQCICGQTEDYGAPDTPCGPDVIPGPARCCATPGWPGGTASCSCETLGCWTNGASCFCTGDQGNNDIYEQIETCEPPTDGTCCLDEGQHICRCGTQTECGELGVPVPSCEVDLLGCFTGLDSVDACVE